MHHQTPTPPARAFESVSFPSEPFVSTESATTSSVGSNSRQAAVWKMRRIEPAGAVVVESTADVWSLSSGRQCSSASVPTTLAGTQKSSFATSSSTIKSSFSIPTGRKSRKAAVPEEDLWKHLPAHLAMISSKNRANRRKIRQRPRPDACVASLRTTKTRRYSSLPLRRSWASLPFRQSLQQPIQTGRPC